MAILAVSLSCRGTNHLLRSYQLRYFLGGERAGNAVDHHPDSLTCRTLKYLCFRARWCCRLGTIQSADSPLGIPCLEHGLRQRRDERPAAVVGAGLELRLVLGQQSGRLLGALIDLQLSTLQRPCVAEVRLRQTKTPLDTRYVLRSVTLHLLALRRPPLGRSETQATLQGVQLGASGPADEGVIRLHTVADADTLYTCLRFRSALLGSAGLRGVLLCHLGQILRGGGSPIYPKTKVDAGGRRSPRSQGGLVGVIHGVVAALLRLVNGRLRASRRDRLRQPPVQRGYVQCGCPPAGSRDLRYWSTPGSGATTWASCAAGVRAARAAAKP